MRQHNPPHPDEFIEHVYIEAKKLDLHTVARQLQINPDEFNRLINGSADITPALASKLSNVLGRTPESWLSMQHNFNLWNLKNVIKFS